MNADVEKIIEATAKEYGVSATDILSSTRRRPIADARMMAVYLVFRKCDYSLTMIGEIFGRNHATISYVVRKVEDLIGFCEGFRRHYECLKNVL